MINSILLLISPEGLHSLFMFLLGWIELGMPQLLLLQLVGQELLAHKVAGVVVGIFIVVSIAQLLHQLGGGIAQMERHRQDGFFRKCWEQISW